MNMKWLKFVSNVIVIFISLSTQAEAGSLYSARSYCSITGSTGDGYGLNRRSARENAVNSCVNEGGVPACCANNVKITGEVYGASSYCSITGSTGKGLAYRQDDAIELAISQCIDNGGVPHCCRNGISY